MTTYIDSLLSRVEDPTLREELERELGRRQFGLVFEKHLPEAVALPGVRVCRGGKVRLRSDWGGRIHVVTKIAGRGKGRVATCLPLATRKDGEGFVATPIDVPVAELVTVAEYGDAIHPGLRDVGSAVGPGADPDAPEHVVINGENLHALEALTYTHGEAVDLIYIDPPYNTGNKTWIYNDNYVSNTDTFRSSRWLSFMERRLRIAQRLLKPSGAIFVSIGDDEQHRLRMLMDQVFGRQNFVVNLAVEMSTTSGPKTTNAQQGTIVKNIEYVLIYRKSEAFDDVKHTPLLDGVDAYDTHYSVWMEDDGSLSTLPEVMMRTKKIRKEIDKLGLMGRGGRFSIKSMDRLLAASPVVEEFIRDNLTRIARLDRPPVSAEGQSTVPGHYIEFETPERTYLLTTLDTGTLQQLMPLAANYRMSDDYKPRFGRTVIRGDLWTGFYQDMGNVAKEGSVAFKNGKKPTRLIKQLIRWANNSPDAVILDFFGGSGTTSHAVMDMNAADGGRRQSVLVTNNEVDAKTTSRLQRAGKRPGDPEWEKEGVFWRATKPRVETVVTGLRPDGTRYSDGLPARVRFYELTYLDPDAVENEEAFEAIAPMLHLAAGGRGEVITAEPYKGFAVTDHYGVLTDIDRLGRFIAALPPTVRTVFVVTSSDTDYARAVAALPAGISHHRLYESYLRNFEINARKVIHVS